MSLVSSFIENSKNYTDLDCSVDNSNNSKSRDSMYMWTCPVCGKQFYVPIPKEWAYWADDKRVCSYHCMLSTRKPEPKMNKKITDVILADTLKKLRIKQGLSRKALAKKLGIAKETIYSVESYERYPSEKTMKAYIEYFGEDVIKTGGAAE